MGLLQYGNLVSKDKVGWRACFRAALLYDLIILTDGLSTSDTSFIWQRLFFLCSMTVIHNDWKNHRWERASPQSQALKLWEEILHILNIRNLNEGINNSSCPTLTGKPSNAIRNSAKAKLRTHFWQKFIHWEISWLALGLIHHKCGFLLMLVLHGHGNAVIATQGDN